MSVVSQEEFAIMQAKVVELEAALVAIAAKLDGDAGVDLTTYNEDAALASSASWDVTNDSDTALRFPDATGKEFLLAAGATVTITGMTAQLTQWETDSVISKIATP